MATVTTSIPVPARGRKGPEPKYAFTKLKPGESVLEDTPAVRGMINKISYLVKVL